MIDESIQLARLLAGRLPSHDGIEAIRLRRLKVLLAYAYQNVPYYRELFRSVRMVPNDVHSISDLRHLPITDRDRLRAAGNHRISRTVDPTSCKVQYSSGSGGKPWAVYRTAAEDRLRRAVELRSMIGAGIRPADRIVTLGPVVAEAPRRTLGALGLFPTMFVSPLLPVEEQARKLREQRPDVFWVYPTALRALLQYAGKLSNIIEPRMIVTSAEPFDEALKNRVLADRPAETRNFYGSVEAGRVAWECPAQEGLHINTDCCILELEEQEALSGADKAVVITNLNSKASPYIRYRLGDLCEFTDRACSCGSPLPLMKAPEGREWDVLHLPSGKVLAPWGMNAIFRSLENLLQFRVIQKRTDLLVLQLQFSQEPPSGVLESVRERLAVQIGEPLTLQIEIVDQFENDKLKFRVYISELGKQGPAAC